MATALQSFCFTARSCRSRPIAQRYAARLIGRRRPFCISSQRWKDKSEEQGIEKILSKSDDLRYHWNNIELPSKEEFEEEIKEDAEEFAEMAMARIPKGPTPRRGKPKNTFLNLGEEEPFEFEDDPEDDHDDLSTLAHGELEHHREMRHYARLAAWEMPLLAKLAKPFEPPTGDMPLRFRYTTYMGEQHPAEKKVVLEFCPEDMPDLTPVQSGKLKKLAGVRYNPETGIVKMSCEMFETQAQNKRYLGDLVDTLLREARDPTDTFEDVPLDTRHHRFKPKPRFPKEWEMTEERAAELAQYREQTAQKDRQRMLAGQIVDGVKQIEAALAKPAFQREALPEMVMAGRGARGNQKRVTVRR